MRIFFSEVPNKMPFIKRRICGERSGSKKSSASLLKLLLKLEDAQFNLKESYHENDLLPGTACWSYAGCAKRMGRCRNRQSAEPARVHGSCGPRCVSVARWTDRRVSMHSVRSREDRTESTQAGVDLRGRRQVGHHGRKETAGFTAGNSAVVEGERQRQHLVHGGRAFGYDDLIADSPRTHDCDRRRNDDG